jgi:uncharacterized protein YjbI with pentapeptide repeats
MDDIDQLRQASASLLRKAEGGSVPELAVAIERAADVQRLAADLEGSRLDARKLELEERKLQEESAAAAKRFKSERTRDRATIVTPVVSILAVVATLWFQMYQLQVSEAGKRDAAEAAQWSEAVKTISQTDKLSPGVVALNPFLKSPKYGDQARVTAVQLLANTSDTVFFNELYGAAFVPIDWSNLAPVIRLDRALKARALPLIDRTWNAQTQSNELSKLDPTERALYDHLNVVLTRISTQVGSLLKASRPPDLTAPDLSGTSFRDSDWEGADASGANLEDARLVYLSVKNANFDRITNFAGIYVYRVAWWEAARISAPLLGYFETNFPYEPNVTYGRNNNARFTPQEYAAALERLKGQAE